jgi:hypothetical protein
VDIVPPLRAQASEADTGRQQEDTCAVRVMSAPTHLLPKFVLQTGCRGHVGPFASSRLAGFLVSSCPHGPKRTATVCLCRAAWDALRKEMEHRLTTKGVDVRNFAPWRKKYILLLVPTHSATAVQLMIWPLDPAFCSTQMEKSTTYIYIFYTTTTTTRNLIIPPWKPISQGTRPNKAGKDLFSCLYTMLIGLFRSTKLPLVQAWCLRKSQKISHKYYSISTMR